MDQKELQEKIAEFYSKLPPKAQEMFATMKWLKTLKAISEKYGLSEEHTATLGTETTLVLLGIIHPVEYEENLTRDLKLPENTMDKILLEIEESIIKTVRPQLVLAFEENKKSESAEIPKQEEKIDKRLETIPNNIKGVVQKSNYQETLYAIGKEYNLTVSQMDAVESVVVGLINGTVHSDEFESTLKGNLKLPEDVMRKLASDIQEKIFMKIRELLKQSAVPGNEKPSIEKENAAKVLNSAGIEIVPGKLELTPPENQPENREAMLKKIEKPEQMTPNPMPLVSIPSRPPTAILEPKENAQANEILAEKLSATFKIPTVKTEHSLQNLSSSDKDASSTAQNTHKIDPYREIPE